MTEAQLAYVITAFRSLRQFSLPGIGTFKKTLAGARIDPKTNTIYPPSEVFEFLPDEEGQLDAFVGLLMRKTEQAYGPAQQLAGQIASEIKKELSSSGTVTISGIGKLFSNEEGALAFELISNDPTLQTYGLAPVEIAIKDKKGLKGRVDEAKKKRGKKERKKHDREKARAKMAKEKKRTRSMVIVLGGLMLALAAVIIVAWPEIDNLINDALGRKKIVEAPAKKKTTKKKKIAKANKNKEEAPEKELEEKEQKANKEKKKPKKKPKQKSAEKKAAPKQPNPTKTTSRSNTASARSYRLVLTQTYATRASATEALGFWQQYGGKIVAIGSKYGIQFGSGSYTGMQRLQRRKQAAGDINPGATRIIR